MKKIFTILGILLTYAASAQIVKIDPAAAKPDQEIEIIYDASQGTGGLKGASSVYMHSGVITEGPDGTTWTNVIGNWGKDDGIGKMTKVKDDIWSLKLKSIRSYYGLKADDVVFRLSMVFRNADGTKEGKGTPGTFTGGFVANNQDIFINLVVGNFIQIKEPSKATILKKPGENLSFSASTSQKADSLSIKVFEASKLIASKSVINADLIELSFLPTKTSLFRVEVAAKWKTEAQKLNKDVNFILLSPIDAKPRPSGIKEGINYGADNTSATLLLLAPKKQIVYVVGDFNDWKIEDKYRMTPVTGTEGYFFYELKGLQAGKPYVFQYWIDGDIKIGDPYADQVADPWNDTFIPSTLYPNLPAYDKKDFGVATVLTTGQSNYNWGPNEASFKPIPKDKMIVYELLIRDFVSTHSYKTVIDSLPYFKKLGINTIELMPIMEFEGNESWGYNPSYFFAPDKYYGTKNDLKDFIKIAHQNGITVILDMVLNHAFGQNPMVKMYWDGGKPSTDNPWFNPEATHPYSVGYDFNHESLYTQKFVDSVNRYWVDQYHFDGFRFDLSKGFTQKVNTDVGLWSVKDDSRIKILKRMNAKLKDKIVILEHFADDTEEAQLHADGMLTWGNGTFGYGNTLTGSNDGIIKAASNTNKVFYMESHDEERLFVKGKNTTGKTTLINYNDSLQVLNRMKLLAAFHFPLPGPKMLWQFQELAYNKSIDFNGRVGNKPLPWGAGSLNLYDDLERQKLLKATATILNMVNNNKETFDLKNLTADLDPDIKSYRLAGKDLNVVVVGNFGSKKDKINLMFTKAGKWYDLFGTDSITVSGTSQSIELFPGNFRIFTSKIINSTKGLVSDLKPIIELDKAEPTIADNLVITFHANLAQNTKSIEIAKQNAIYMVAAPIQEGPNSTKLGEINGAEVDIFPMTKVAGTDDWTINFSPKAQFGENVFRMAVYFRNTGSTSEGKGYDKSWMYINFKNAGQIVSIKPEVFDELTPITITFDAAAADAGGTQGLVGVSKVYMHSGIIDASETGTTWKYVVGNWGKDDGIGKMTQVGSTNKWQISIKAKDYYKEVPTASKWYRIGMVFRNETGTREGKGQGGKDIFVNFTPGTTQLPTATEPEYMPIVFPNPSNGKINIKSKDVINRLDLYNFSGQKQRELDETKSEFQINPGSYILKIETKKAIYYHKIIVN